MLNPKWNYSMNHKFFYECCQNIFNQDHLRWKIKKYKHMTANLNKYIDLLDLSPIPSVLGRVHDDCILVLPAALPVSSQHRKQLPQVIQVCYSKALQQSHSRSPSRSRASLDSRVHHQAGHSVSAHPFHVSEPSSFPFPVENMRNKGKCVTVIIL